MRFPNKLQPGDEVRVVAPSTSMSISNEENRRHSMERLEEMGLGVTFGKHVDKSDEFSSSSIQSRVEDIHDAFRDPNVKAILTFIGGYNVNQLLRYLDYDLIRKNPKILCGYSDITALGTAIYTQSDLVTYSGPHFSTFGMVKGLEYTIEQFKKCLMAEEPYEIHPADYWSNDPWYRDQENRTFNEQGPFDVLQQGEAEGTIIGGNLCTLNLLQGTEYMPSLKDKILFLEDDYLAQDLIFDRDLQSLLHLPDADKIKGLVIGRFQPQSEVSDEALRLIIERKAELEGIPIISNVNFGHTQPVSIFPIGGKARILANAHESKIEIVEH
ncbi:S66 peptidase family protein [Pseudalkalibacillus sp. A8]|uniref:S66 family peptidase n=1 Tax=Pseudalkalibacillus sp. A8 TaxID=3382641 RepID=UPI0038B5A77A